MDPHPTPGTPSATPPGHASRRLLRPWRRAIGPGLVVLGALGFAVWMTGRPTKEEHFPEHSNSDRDDPRLTYSGPFRNIHPDTRYVGMAACAECHEDKVRSFLDHPMGRALTLISPQPLGHPYAEAGLLGGPAGSGRLPALDVALDQLHHNPFEAFGINFHVERDADGRSWHRQTRFDARGQPAYQFDMEAHYAIGSGSHGHSYLTNRNGYLFQTPISWFSHKQIWDVSPGFVPPLTGRPVQAGCLFCHTNRTNPVEGTLNRYQEPIFDGLAIGCERCHGPGALHVQARQRHETPAGPDYTIVDPGRLQPSLREAVCEQCHLEGEVRVLRRGRGLYDYRPGLPLQAFWSVFVPASDDSEDARAVSHVDQMYQSRCFRQGEGRLGCTSCHDPHERVPAGRRVEHFRRACLNCHEQHGCSLPLEERHRQNRQDSCIDCHMPRFAASDIAHTASTDHRILRRPHQKPAAPLGGPREHQTGLPVSFYPAGPDSPAAEQARDLGLALTRMTKGGRIDPARFSVQTVRLLEAALKNAPDDLDAWEAKAEALRDQRRLAEVLAAYQTVLDRQPQRETALVGAAAAAHDLQEPDLAIGYWRRAIALNPWAPSYRKGLVVLLEYKQAWDEIGPQCRDWIRLEPANVQARTLLITYLVKKGNRADAQVEFDRLEALRPPNLNELRSWFAALKP